MAYIVLSEAFGTVGAVLEDEDLVHCNVPALVEAGHLTAHEPVGQIAADTKEQ